LLIERVVPAASEILSASVGLGDAMLGGRKWKRLVAMQKPLVAAAKMLTARGTPWPLQLSSLKPFVLPCPRGRMGLEAEVVVVVGQAVMQVVMQLRRRAGRSVI
jgi:hypothetical protein